MKNFAEELAYWYLRFNGFFVIDDFVLHNKDLDSSQNADVDLLAVRHKFTYENIGGAEVDKDKNLFRHFDPDKTIGIICEVKSSSIILKDKIRLNQLDRLTYAVHRLGFFEAQDAREQSVELMSKPVVKGDHHQIGKVLIVNNYHSYPEYIYTNLRHVRTFLYDHIERHREPKGGAKHFFSSELLQYIIWDIENS